VHKLSQTISRAQLRKSKEARIQVAAAPKESFEMDQVACDNRRSLFVSPSRD
jgi:hypothetical protein